MLLATTQKTILITGAAGYIGSHIAVELLSADYNIIALDNLCNSSAEVIDRVKEISQADFPFYTADIRDFAALTKILASHQIDAVVHLAGLKSVGESVLNPLLYYDNNISGTITLLKALEKASVKYFVFSSSATVYGNPQTVPIREDARIETCHSYGDSKAMIEQILNRLSSVGKLKVAILRYFNPIGAHESGLIGDNPREIPNNLMPYITQVASKQLDKLFIFGNDWQTKDGTAVRDYIHVVDLAQGHLVALEYLFKQGDNFTVNLGTGHGYSVLEVVKTFERVNQRKVPYEFTKRRPGDIAVCYADPSLAKKLLGWVAQKGLEEMCRDAWVWQSKKSQQ